MNILKRILMAYGNLCLSIGHQLTTLYDLAVWSRCPMGRLRKQALAVLITQVFLYLLFFVALQSFLICQRAPDLALNPWRVHWDTGTLEVISGGALFLVVWLDVMSAFAYSRFGRGW